MKICVLGLSCACRSSLVKCTTSKSSNAVINSSTVHNAFRRFPCCSFHSSPEITKNDKDMGILKTTLAKNLASLLDESSRMGDKRPKTRIELKRLIEVQVKKRVKEQFVDGKFHNLIERVIADPKTLEDAYNCIRINSNIDLTSHGDNLPFESMAKELSCGDFDVRANTIPLPTKRSKNEILVLPNLKLKVIQEAIRMVLEIVYKPHFSKVSHGFRSGRGHHSALKYMCKQISNADWCFTLSINKKVDDDILRRLFSSMENNIEDSQLFAIIERMHDGHALNFEFGGFPKGYGLPQEGILSPILMNIYLDLFDREFYRMSLKYEAFNTKLQNEQKMSVSNLRSWFRRQINGTNVSHANQENCGIRVHCCRVMDEILCVISGSKEVALLFKTELQSYVHNSLHLNVEYESDVLPCNGPHGIQFLGNLIKKTVSENPRVRTVHKLKEKVGLFASQKQEAWDSFTAKIGKRWLAFGLKEVKKSEIKNLADGNSLLGQMSKFRMAGMETDHWYKVLLKIWMQNMTIRSAESEVFVLSKYVAEPALPLELKDSFYKFQKCAEHYVSSETASTLALLPNSLDESVVTKIIAPVNSIKKRLMRYGLVNANGYPQTCYILITQDPDHIIDWFTGIAQRWLKWYGKCNNFNEVKLIISNQVRMSCVRTLAAKYRIHETEIEKKFDSELSRISSTDEVENKVTAGAIDSQLPSVDEALMYGLYYSGLCLVSLARMVSQSRPCNCFIAGCNVAAPCVYTLHVMERQRFPGWKTGFSSCLHPALHKRQIALCKQHLKDLYIGNISLQSVDFGAWR